MEVVIANDIVLGEYAETVVAAVGEFVVLDNVVAALVGRAGDHADVQ